MSTAERPFSLSFPRLEFVVRKRKRRGRYGALGRSSIHTDTRSRRFESNGAGPDLFFPQLDIGQAVEQIYGHSITLTWHREK
jgi:hypothetical protein